MAAVFAAQLALNYPSFAEVCVTIRIYTEQSTAWRAFFLEFFGPLNREALGRLPTPPKAKAGTVEQSAIIIS